MACYILFACNVKYLVFKVPARLTTISLRVHKATKLKKLDIFSSRFAFALFGYLSQVLLCGHLVRCFSSPFVRVWVFRSVNEEAAHKVFESCDGNQTYVTQHCVKRSDSGDGVEYKDTAVVKNV